MIEIATRASHISLPEERSAKPEESSADKAEAMGGQMEKIKIAIEQLLQDGAPLSILIPTQAWRRAIDQLKSTGVNVRELPHASTNKRFREKYTQQYGLR